MMKDLCLFLSVNWYLMDSTHAGKRKYFIHTFIAFMTVNPKHYLIRNTIIQSSTNNFPLIIIKFLSHISVSHLHFLRVFPLRDHRTDSELISIEIYRLLQAAAYPWEEMVMVKSQREANIIPTLQLSPL